MGYEDAAAEIQEQYMAGDTAGALAAVPHDLIDATTLIGTKERVADRLRAYAEAGVTTLIASHGGAAPGGPAAPLAERLVTLRTLAEAAELAGI
jgi:alkanesulfonate monooxygenase SsuD/methylene tetrahydromethanopterin reductase-like flavin-dependent oxidoreductase (luciferase family)